MWQRYSVTWKGVHQTQDRFIENCEFQLDLEWWWKKFLNSWHRVSFWLFSGLTPCSDFEVFSDASGSVGFGAFCGREWFNGTWLAYQNDPSIPYKELFPVVIAADLFTHRWCKNMFCSDETMKQWWQYSILAHQKFLPSCISYAICFSLQLAFSLPFPLHTSPALKIQLLMHCLVFIGRSFVG